MSYASYEPIQSTRPDAVDSIRAGGAFHSVSAMVTDAQQPQPKKESDPIPEKQPVKESTWADISEYEELLDWVYIFIGVVVVEVILLFLVRYFPEFFGKFLNVWYNRFKLSAVAADVLIIMIGIGLARYVYSEFIYPTYDWNPVYFTGTAVLIQILHDILFYFGVIKTLPEGHNAMIDVFKQYASEKGAGAILGDSVLVLASCVLSMLLKSVPSHITALSGIGALYTIPFILETRNVFSSIS